MATKFLRQIILEELKKVLKEDASTLTSDPSDPRDDEPLPTLDASYGKTIPAEPIDLGTQKIVARKGPCAGMSMACNPKILQYQKLFNMAASKLNLKKLKEDGVVGKDTLTIYRLTQAGSSANAKDFMKNINSNVEYMKNVAETPEVLAVLKSDLEEDPGEVETAGSNIFDQNTAAPKSLDKSVLNTPLELPESLIRKEITKLLKNL